MLPCDQITMAQRTRNLYNPNSNLPYRMSRSKLELFTKCARCFYLDCRLGIGQPPGFPFNLNSAVDHLLKKEFDIHRANGNAHPLMKAYKIDAIPFSHPKLNDWRENFVGIQHLHEKTNLLITGAIDDVWINAHGELHVVDYKATSKTGEISLDAEWQNSYKRQMEIYQWLLRRTGFTVSRTGYFVYCNGKKDNEAFDGKLEFDIHILSYEGDDSWIEDTINRIYRLLGQNSIPQESTACEYCSYRKAASLNESW